MIVIVSSIVRERAAFASVCTARGWAHCEADSIRAFKKICEHLRPHVVLTRHRLTDGYSDDAIALVTISSRNLPPKILVLLSANTPSSVEVRQIALGADCIQRDPVRTEVIAAYLAKYREPINRKNEMAPSGPTTFRFAGAKIDPIKRTFEHADKVIHLTPREVELGQLLANSGEFVTYETLYGEILGRKFRGDTSNLRVLLGKLDNSAHSAGVDLRRWIQVVPKLGYRYLAVESAAAPREKEI